MAGWPKWAPRGEELENRCSLQQFSIETKSKTGGKDGAVHPTSMFLQQSMAKMIQGYQKGILKSADNPTVVLLALHQPSCE